MRSLSLESIPANKNMKLLSLLVTLLALLSSANSDRTKKTFTEIKKRLNSLEKQDFDVHDISVDIQTPRDIENACDCKVSFAKHLKGFLMSLKSVVPRNQLANIYDNLRPFINQPDDNCTFTHHSTRLTSENMKNFIQDYKQFIQDFLKHCLTKYKIRTQNALPTQHHQGQEEESITQSVIIIV